MSFKCAATVSPQDQHVTLVESHIGYITSLLLQGGRKTKLEEQHHDI